MRPRWHRSDGDHDPAAHDDVRRPDAARRRAGACATTCTSRCPTTPSTPRCSCSGATAPEQAGRRRPAPHRACAGCRPSPPGPDAALAAGFADDVVITSGRGLHDGPVAEHTLALRARRGPAAARPRARAGRSTGGPASSAACRTRGPVRRSARSTGAQRADLGLRLHRRPARTAAQRAGRAGHGRRDRRRRPARLPGDLRVRPARPPAAHRRAGLAAARHGRRPGTRSTPASSTCCPPRAWVVNVGRGATLDEAALLDALRSDRLAGAALDVFETEPLPADSPLWDEPRILISPHAAGGRPHRRGRAGDARTSRRSCPVASCRNVVAR